GGDRGRARAPAERAAGDAHRRGAPRRGARYPGRKSERNRCSETRKRRRRGAPVSVARKSFEVQNRLGLHARAATKLVQLASRFDCDITISRDGQSANAKSVMGVLLLCGSKGTALLVEANGESADEAVRQIGELIDGRFGEEE